MKIKFLLFLLLTFQISFSQKNEIKKINRDGYTIYYDEHFRLDESGRNGTEFSLFVEKASKNKHFLENLILKIVDLETINVVDVYDFSEIINNEINTVYKDGKIIDSKISQINQIDFHKVIYEAKFNEMELKFLQYSFIKNNKAYVLNYTAKVETFETYLNDIETVIKSFKID